MHARSHFYDANLHLKGSVHIDTNVRQNSPERILNPCLLAISIIFPLQDDYIKLLVEVKARIGVLQLEEVSLCEVCVTTSLLRTKWVHTPESEEQAMSVLFV